MKLYDEQEPYRRLTRLLKAEGGYRKAAAKTGLSFAYLWQVDHRITPPGESLLAALGLVREVRYTASPSAPDRV